MASWIGVDLWKKSQLPAATRRRTSRSGSQRIGIAEAAREPPRARCANYCSLPLATSAIGQHGGVWQFSDSLLKLRILIVGDPLHGVDSVGGRQYILTNLLTSPVEILINHLSCQAEFRILGYEINHIFPVGLH